ncbi:MAG: Asp-tRNA(Asn)/Glu-tRNA(Gln) amidotransferase subunit GatA [Saprospiraceae bacterium]|nr:Asp-tRNA(Asn)/Glu-tRNA(Gln) amidotransferase subunit GatA [Saprospiraceae bacterium]
MTGKKIPVSYQLLKKEILEGNISIEEVVSQYLDIAEASSHLNVYIEIYKEEALARARELDQKLKDNPASAGRLLGLVVSVKDVLCYKSHPVTAGSKILQGFNSAFNATAINRLIEEDAIIIGRVNCDEFAMGSTNENSYYGPTMNGDNPDLIPGGSSGASAVSVQIGSCMVSLGSDTGGSVRQPASFCGVTGFKPSYGRISRYGLIAYASSFDQIGILSRSYDDIALVLECIAGPDEYDSTATMIPSDLYSEYDTGKAYRIAYIKEAIDHPSLSEINRRLFSGFKERLTDAGHKVDAVSFSLLDYLVPVYYILTTAEASSNLSRYDGVRYGYRSDKPADIHTLYTQSRGEGFGMEVKRRIMLGAFVLSAGYYDAYYKKAQSVRNLIKKEIEQILDRYDFIMMPCTTGKAWKLGEMMKDPVEMYLSDVFTVLANLTGQPAISIPLKVDNDTPDHYGVQILGKSMQEKTLFSFINNSIKLA